MDLGSTDLGSTDLGSESLKCALDMNSKKPGNKAGLFRFFGSQNLDTPQQPEHSRVKPSPPNAVVGGGFVVLAASLITAHALPIVLFRIAIGIDLGIRSTFTLLIGVRVVRRG